MKLSTLDALRILEQRVKHELSPDPEQIVVVQMQLKDLSYFIQAVKLVEWLPSKFRAVKFFFASIYGFINDKLNRK